MRDGRSKFIDALRPELYDLETDPFEEHNLYATGSATAARIARRLDDLYARGLDASSGQIDPVPADLKERLAALGYLGAEAHSPSPAGRDPKDFIETYNAMQRASRSALR